MLPSLLNIIQINYPAVLKRVAISSGSGNLASTASVEVEVSASLPYSISSKAANLVLSTLVNKSDSNNLLFEAFNFNKNYIDFKLNIQIVEDENVIEEYTFDSTPRIEYNERFDKGSLQYMTRLVIKGENLNDYKN